jgi:glycosyltransferase involved in cell wall biosynthesis
MTGVFLDTAFLADRLIGRHALGVAQAEKLQVLYTPAMNPAVDVVLAEMQVARAHLRDRPCILWAGRFDRQKRFHLLVAIAKAMPEVDFLCWGKAVLDAAPDFLDVPANLQVNGPFTYYEDLPLSDCDGWLYTASWDGMPTILIEIAQMGMPVVASAVGGIPELVDETTGWPVPPGAGVRDYVAVLREMLGDPAARQEKGRSLRARTGLRHHRDQYRQRLGDILRETDPSD